MTFAASWPIRNMLFPLCVVNICFAKIIPVYVMRSALCMHIILLTLEVGDNRGEAVVKF